MVSSNNQSQGKTARNILSPLFFDEKANLRGHVFAFSTSKKFMDEFIAIFCQCQVVIIQPHGASGGLSLCLVVNNQRIKNKPPQSLDQLSCLLPGGSPGKSLTSLVQSSLRSTAIIHHATSSGSTHPFVKEGHCLLRLWPELSEKMGI